MEAKEIITDGHRRPGRTAMIIKDETGMEVHYDHPDIWCKSQAFDTAIHGRICLAHLADGRLFKCWCESPEATQLSSEHNHKQCEDFAALEGE